MVRSIACCAWAALALAACQPPPVPTTASTPIAEPLDPFVVSIDAQRWGVIIDRAIEGVQEAPDGDPALADSDILRADAALKNGAASLIVLRNRACVKGLVEPDLCKLKDWPQWTLEPPSADTPLQTLDQRGAWLSQVMSPFQEVGCEAGRKASGDYLFCSVE
ncbi:MAG: hypothetical protein SGJ21_13695 [Alphaproteobacteria bacterium]|nr:hypothetical protein [Alphaproteobacteria bacterium]